MTKNSNRLLLLAILLLLGSCATSSGPPPTMADMNIVARDESFALVRLRGGQDFDDLARVFLGHSWESWQLREVNAMQNGRAGQVVAVPLRPMNSSSIYTDGYRTLPILCYHQFTKNAQASHQLELSAKTFEQQIRYLVDNGYALLSFADVQAILQQSQPIPDRAVVITIDDGYRSVYDVAWPILRKYQANATLFIYTDFIGAPAALSWQQLQEMATTGQIEVQSHAKSHTSLSRQPEDKNYTSYKARVRQELRGSNEAFRKHFGEAPDYLSYPYGNSSDIAASITKEEGIQLAATVARGENTVFSDHYLLHRTMIYAGLDLNEFEKLVRGFTDKNLK